MLFSQSATPSADSLTTTLPNSFISTPGLQDPFNPNGQTLNPTSSNTPTIFTVNSIEDRLDPNDSKIGVMTLREAIAAANQQAGADIINFNLGTGAHTITLNSRLLISDSLEIDGPGADSLTISGNQKDLIFGIAGLAGTTVTLDGLTIADGKSGSETGGIWNRANLNIVNSVLKNNTVSDFGGAILNDGTLTITHSTLSSNTGGFGGALRNLGTATIIDSTITNNSAFVDGGGIWNGNSLTLLNTTLSGNTTTLENGGALYNGSRGTLTVTNSTFSGNTAAQMGGAIFNSSDPTRLDSGCTLTNSTFSGNAAKQAGGIYNAPISGGATGGVVTGKNILIHNTIVAGNQDQSGNPDVFGNFTSQGFNLIGTGTGSTGLVNLVNGDLVGTTALPIDAKLGALQDNGGPTWTMAPLAGSPVIDRGDPFNTPITDQRGIVRPTTTRSTIGAVEFVKSLQVDSLLDENDRDYSPGHLSLREAIQLVGDRGSITFDPLLSGTITLDMGQLLLNKNLTLDGSTTPDLSFSGDQQSRIFEVGSGATVNLVGLTLTDGQTSGDGGAILVDSGATLRLTQSKLIRNIASNGGGIRNNGNLTIRNSALSGNTASNQGGGISNAGTLAVINTTLTRNTAVKGGGLFNDTTGTATLTRSTLSANTATDAGGGILNQGTLTASNSTLSGNTAKNSGGGIHNQGRLSLSFDTITLNQALVGGGVFTVNIGQATVGSNIIAGNSLGAFGRTGADVWGDFLSQGYNLIGDGAGSRGFSGIKGDQVGNVRQRINPNLGPLQNNGGATFTHLLLDGSPAINAANPTVFPNIDQRGRDRTNDRPDIGAVEL